MKKILLLASVTAALIFSSCKKDKDEPGTGGATKVLKKIIQTTDGEETVYNFNYNTAKQLVSIISADNTEMQTFTYDAAGKLTGTVDENGEAKETLSFTYANGLPVSGVYKLFEKGANQSDELVNELQMTYTVTNSQVTKIHANYVKGTLEADFSLTYTNGNLTKVTAPGDHEVTYTYGNKKPAFPKVFDFIMDISGQSVLFGAKNDLVAIGGHDPNTIEYTYDANGYVLTSDEADGTHMKFEYQ